jgi:glycosyltransferase involved in cell wall biosynthesis
LKLGVDVRVVTLKTPNLYAAHDILNVKRLRPLVAVGNAGWVPQAIWAVLKSDVIHFHYPFIGGEVVLLAKLFKPKIKIVVTYHMDLQGSGIKGIFFKLYQAIALQLIRFCADVIIFSSFDYGRSSAFSSYIKKHSEKCRELPFGVEGNVFYPGDSLNERLICNKVLFVATLDKAHSFKGLPILLRAMCNLQNGRLVIVGDGDLRESYQRLVVKLEMEDRVTFLGRLNDQDLATEFRTSKLFVLPSISRSEAFGLVILEALSSGVPVVASNLPGVRKVVSNGEDGFLVPPGDVNELREKINLLLNDDKLNDRLGKAGRSKVIEKYSWPAITRLLLTNIYRITTK